ncbi:Vma21p [Sporobolomyces koalae]|uniref:Vma21p n=1 Tax=Sporobolomyces koalae TaxID=500713 RepID=UPI0031826097
MSAASGPSYKASDARSTSPTTSQALSYVSARHHLPEDSLAFTDCPLVFHGIASIKSSVVWKLAIFTLMMIVGPIGTYFVTLHHYFHDPTKSAITAALVANLVLIGFVVVAFLEDQDDVSATTGVRPSTTTQSLAEKKKE